METYQFLQMQICDIYIVIDKKEGSIMALRKIVTKGDDILTKKTRLVEKFDAKLSQLIDDMIETMHHEKGVGIAAPQVGILRSVVIIEPEEGKTLAMVNPEILSAEGEAEGSEGCLSVPGVYGYVKRPTKVTVRAQDKTGHTFTMKAEGFAARVVCHELDHLSGILFDSKVTRFEE